jgi:uncharacterized surface protein with fasciclin (FAS1) repeats
MRKLIAFLAVALVATSVLAAQAPAASNKTIVQTAASAGQFTTLVSLVKKAGLAGALSSGTYTVFAPTDAAFKKVPKATLTKVANDPALLKKVLTYHVVKGKVPAAKVVTLNGKKVNTLAGAPVRISIRGGKVFLNGSTQVIKADVTASNGVIHVVNKVLLPPS